MDQETRQLTAYHYETGRTVPRYELLYRLLLDRIQTLPPECEYLPSQAELSSSFAVSKNTARRAFAKLSRNGYIRTGKRAGTRILKRTVDAWRPLKKHPEFDSAAGMLFGNSRPDGNDRSDIRWEVVDAAEQMFVRNGVRLVVYNLREDDWRVWGDPERVIESLCSNGIRSVFYAPSLNEEKFPWFELHEQLLKRGIRVILMLNSMDSFREVSEMLVNGCGFVGVNSLPVLRIALEKVRTPELRRIVYVANEAARLYADRRAAVCRRFAREAGLEFAYLQSPYRYLCDAETNRGKLNLTPRIGEDLMRLVTEGDGETLVFCANDYTAQSLLKLVDLPETCRVFGYDGTRMAVRMGISTFSFNPKAQAEAMLELYANPSSKAPGIIVNAQFIERPASARLYVEFRDEAQIYSGTAIANWNELLVDNIALWQSATPDVPMELRRLVYAPVLLDGNRNLPPQLPAGTQRSNSVALLQARDENGAFNFKSDGKKTEINLYIANLIGYDRTLELRGKIFDQDGKACGDLKHPCKLTPYQLAKIPFQMAVPAKYGAYTVELEVLDQGKKVGASNARFVWLERRTRISKTDRYSDRNPFDMHPGYINFNHTDTREIERKARLFALLGVRGIRLQTRYCGVNLDDPEQAAAQGRKLAEQWKKHVLPSLKKYEIRSWVSLMEQGLNNLPRIPLTEKEFAAWKAYHREFARTVGNDVEFILFGNEGLGGYTAHHKPDENLFRTSTFCGTTRDWMKCYRAAYLGIKEGNPAMPAGPAQASDVHGLIAKAFLEFPESGKRFDCWGMNSYMNPSKICAAVFRRLGNPAPPVFGVIPEVGFNVPVSGPDRIRGEKMMAGGIPIVYLTTLSEAPWVRRIAWFTMSETGGFALFDSQGAARPGAAAYAVMTDRLGAGRIEKHIPVNGGGDFYIWRRIDGTAVGVGYSTASQTLALSTDAPELIQDDLYGNHRTVAVNQGEATVQLTPEITYLLGGKKLDLSDKYRFATFESASKSGPEAGLRIENKSGSPMRFKVRASAHPLIKIDRPEREVAVAPGAAAELRYALDFYRHDPRRKYSVAFEIAAGTMKYPARLESTFALCRRAPAGFKIDGTWAAWKNAQVLPADRRNQVELLGNAAKWNGPDDLSAGFMTMWDEKNFYFGVKVKDDTLFRSARPDRMFFADAIELGFDLENRRSPGAVLWQFSLGLTGDRPVLYGHLPSSGAVELPAETLIVRPNGKAGGLDYQVAIPWSRMGNFRPAAGRRIGFGALADDCDVKSGEALPRVGLDRKIISWFGGGVQSKQTQELGLLTFSE